MSPPDDVRAAAETAYRAGIETVAEIAARLAVPVQQIYGWRRELGWPARRGGRPKRVSRRAHKGRRTVGKQALVGRLYRAIEAKLEQLEASMSTTETPDAVSNEREARALATLIRNFEKVTALETDLVRSLGNESNSGPAEAGPDDASRMRRELAERIRRVRERRAGSPGGGPCRS